MYGSGLRKLAGELELTTGKGVVCGVAQGVGLSLWEGMGVKCMGVHLGLRDAEWPDFGRMLEMPAQKYRIQHFLLDEERGVLTITFHDTIGTMKRIRDFIRVELPKYRAAGFPGASVCAHCGQPLADGQAHIEIRPDSNAPLPMHGECAAEAERLAAERALTDATPRRVVLPVLGAVVGAVVGAIPWVVAYLFGFLTSIAGFLIAMGAAYGHRALGGRPGRARTIAVVLATLLMVPIALGVGEVGSLAVEVRAAIQDGSLAQAWGYAEGEITMDHWTP
ncbi:MAG: hypothetical protein GX558_05645, partial [Clostridiales bacterium]|nr:hypothetical protein [Clostridiales bacterium]